MTRSFVVKTEELDACPNCHSRRLRAWRTGRDRLYGLSEQEFSYSRCRDCALVFLSLRPTAEEAHKFYPEHYGPYHAGRNQALPVPTPLPGRYGPLMKLMGRVARRLLEAVTRRMDTLSPDDLTQRLESYYRPRVKGLKLLDFGCGSDAFLNRAAAQGWETIGVDFSETTVRRVAASGHRALLMTPGVWDELEDESLDFVRMSHVLEHLYTPREVLRELRRKMKAGAVLHVSVPNPDGLSSKLFRSRWWGLECPRHVLLYSPGVLRRVLSEFEFSETETLHEVVTKDCARSLGYLLSDRGWIGHGEIEGMMSLPGLAGALMLPARVAAALGRADRYHVFARKT